MYNKANPTKYVGIVEKESGDIMTIMNSRCMGIAQVNINLLKRSHNVMCDLSKI